MRIACIPDWIAEIDSEDPENEIPAGSDFLSDIEGLGPRSNVDNFDNRSEDSLGLVCFFGHLLSFKLTIDLIYVLKGPSYSLNLLESYSEKENIILINPVCLSYLPMK